MCIDVFLYIYLYNMCMLGAQEGQRNWICFSDPLELELQVLGIELRSFGGRAGVLDC